MLFKRKKSDTVPTFNTTPVLSFSSITDTADRWLHQKKCEEQILLLNYLIDVLIDDVCSENTVNSVFLHKNSLNEPFPRHFLNSFHQSGSIISSSDDKCNVELTSAHVMTLPWNTERTIRSLFNISKNDFKYMPNNHFSLYYADINLLFVYNGNHSINAGKYFEKGTVAAELASMELLYQNCFTDGIYWYDIHTRQKLAVVNDFRMAAVYRLAQMRYELRENFRIENKNKGEKIE